MNFELHQGTFFTGEDGFSTHTRVFRVYTGTPSNRPSWGVADVAINRFDVHPDDATCLANAASSVPVAGELGWFDVTYTYTNKPFDKGAAAETGEPGTNDAQSITDPTARTGTIRFSSNTRMVPFTKDRDNPRKPVANSAGEPFEGKEVEDITSVITYSFNLPSTTDVVAKQEIFLNTVNDDAFTLTAIYGTYPPGTLRCNAWGGTMQSEEGYGWYLAAEVEFEFKRDGWEITELDRGHYFKVPGLFGADAQQVMRKFRDNAIGQPLGAMRYLDGTGEPLADAAAPVELTFYPYEWVDFTNILS
jgi:hypothetical protein